MNAKLRVLLFIALGVACIVIGIDMKDKQIRWSETSDNTTNIPGTKNRNALIGVGTGAASGGVLAFLVGGVGIVFCGTGVGLPAGAAIITLASVLGGTAGGITGAALGTSSSTHSQQITVWQSAPAYESWQWVTLLIIGATLLGFAVLEIINTPKTEPNAEADGGGMVRFFQTIVLWSAVEAGMPWRNIMAEWADMKNIGTVAVVLGFLVWFGGEIIYIVPPYNTIGLPILGIGAMLYFVGNRKKNSLVKSSSE